MSLPPAALHNIQLVKTAQELLHCCAIIAKEPQIAIDTEFDRNRFKYGLNLCVAQIATPQVCYIIDPLSICRTDAEFRTLLQPMWDIVNDPQVEKIIYDCTEDLKVFVKYGCKPANIFDLKIAEKVLALQSTSFVSLIKNTIDVNIDKQLQVTNWHKRPLSEQMMEYLANDVVFLIEVKQMLAQQLQQTQRTPWFEEEMKQLIIKQAIEIDNGLPKFETNARYKQLPDNQKLAAMELWLLRDRFAQKYNVPHHYVFSEDKLFHFAEHLQQYLTSAHWENEKGIHRRLKEQDLYKFINQLQHIAQKIATMSPVMPPAQVKNYTPNPNPANDAVKIEREKFKEFMLPIQQHLEAKYDKKTQEIILSNRYVQDLFKYKRLDVIKKYAAQEVLLAAQELNINLATYLQI